MLAAAASQLLLAATLSAADLSFQVSALDGATVPFSELRGERVTVVAFISSKCPISFEYQDRLNRIYREYAAKGVGFAILNANANESPSDIKSQIKGAKLGFPVYKDYHNRAADLFDAQTTPEVFVIDASGKIRYHGAIDDSTNEARVKRHVLRDALDALLASKEPPVSELKAFGCVLKREKPTT